MIKDPTRFGVRHNHVLLLNNGFKRKHTRKCSLCSILPLSRRTAKLTVSYLALSGDEDIYAYGDSDPDPVWTLSSHTVVFREKLTLGHFAEIRKAKLVINRKQAITVAAKALKRKD